MLTSILGTITSALAAQAFSAHHAPTEFVVIAPEAFRESLAPFVAHRNESLPTAFAALEPILAGSPGVDDPEKLKRWLFAQWSTGVRYTLLVGDADTMPVRYMVLDRITEPAFDIAFYPSDLYYADLAEADGSFEDWNAQRDGFHAGYFGEVCGERNKSGPINLDAVDYRPEIAVGRWPVSTPAEAAIVAAKTIAFGGVTRSSRATEGAMTPPGAAPRALFVHCDGWVDARPRFDALADALATSGWSITKLHHGGDTPPSDAAVVEAMNAGVELIAHGGHGHPHGWEHALQAGSIERLKARTSDDQTGVRLPIVISVGCNTAAFATLPPYEPYIDAEGVEHKGTNAGEVFTAPPPPPATLQRGPHNATGLGELLLRAEGRGAIAYIGCNTGSQPCALSLLDGFMRAVAATKTPRLGDCWNAAITSYIEKERLMSLAPTESWYPPSIFFQGMKFMLFGDPTIPVGR